MPYITNKKRAHLAKQTSQSYVLRKVIISIAVVSLIVLVAFAIVCIATYVPILMEKKWGEGGTAKDLLKELATAPLPLVIYWEKGDDWGTKLSAFSYFMIIWTVITLGLSIASMVLMLTMRSPKATKKGISTMQGAALSGKKLGKNATQIYRERATNPKKLKKGKVSK